MLDVALAFPVAMGGNGQGTNPEQLLAAGFAACFESSLRNVARRAKVPLRDARVAGTVGLWKDSDGDVDLRIELDVAAECADERVLEDLIAQAESICPYARALGDSIPIEIRSRAVRQ